MNNLVIPSRPVNSLTASWPSYPELVDYTVYDMQSNASVQNRLYLYPDGTLAGTWMRGMNSSESFPDLGTGYNTSDGANWGAPPAGRIENGRSTPGRQVITLDIRWLTSGVYFYIVNIGNENHLKRMIVE